MNRNTTTAIAIALALATLAAGNAIAAEPMTAKTRAQVQAELVQAQRTGDIMNSEGQKLNQLFPNSYPRKG